MSERPIVELAPAPHRPRRVVSRPRPVRPEPPAAAPAADLAELLRRVARIVRVDGCEIYLQDPGGKTLTLVAACGPDTMFVGSKLGVGEGLAGRVFQRLRHMAVEDYVNWEGCAPLFWNCRGCEGCSALAVPIRLDQEPIGVLTAQAVTKRKRFSRIDLRLLEACATLVAFAMTRSSPGPRAARPGSPADGAARLGEVVDLVALTGRFQAEPAAPQAEPRLGDAFPCNLLTRRESEVAQLVAEGASNGEIAERLGLKLRTVKFHMGNILAKLQLRSRTQLAIWAAEQSWLTEAAAERGVPPFLGKVAWTEPATEDAPA